MTRTNVPEPELGGDLLRVHRAITRALGVAREHGEAFGGAGHPDAGTWQGYLIYVRCLAALLHAHHTTEDEAVFPDLCDRLPQAPCDALMAQHRAMEPVLGEIEAALTGAPSAGPERTLEVLLPALARLDDLWQTHIALEEAHFGPQALGRTLTMAERRRAGRATSRHAARHQRPFALMLPFLLYNMVPEDRAVMLQLMPPIVPLLLGLFKPRWRALAPFLLAGLHRDIENGG
jgi:hypothetical protein